jgi:diphthamide synthase subunit DPH2
LDVKLKKKKTEGEEETDSVQKRWEHLEQAIKATAEEIMGETKLKKNEEWLDEECATYIREKNKARKKMLKKRDKI